MALSIRPFGVEETFHGISVTDRSEFDRELNERYRVQVKEPAGIDGIAFGQLRWRFIEEFLRTEPPNVEAACAEILSVAAKAYAQYRRSPESERRNRDGTPIDMHWLFVSSGRVFYAESKNHRSTSSLIEAALESCGFAHMKVSRLEGVDQHRGWHAQALGWPRDTGPLTIAYEVRYSPPQRWSLP